MREYTNELVWALSTLTPSLTSPGGYVISSDDRHRIAHMMRKLEDKVAECEAAVRGAQNERDWAVKELNMLNQSLVVLVGDRDTEDLYLWTSIETLDLRSNQHIVCRMTDGDFARTLPDAVKVRWNGGAVPLPSQKEAGRAK